MDNIRKGLGQSKAEQIRRLHAVGQFSAQEIAKLVDTSKRRVNKVLQEERERQRSGKTGISMLSILTIVTQLGARVTKLEAQK